MQLKIIAKLLSSMAKDYEGNTSKALKLIKNILRDTGFTEKENNGTKIWFRDSEFTCATEEITIVFDKQRNEISITPHWYCRHCGNALENCCRNNNKQT